MKVSRALEITPATELVLSNFAVSRSGALVRVKCWAVPCMGRQVLHGRSVGMLEILGSVEAHWAVAHQTDPGEGSEIDVPARQERAS